MDNKPLKILLEAALMAAGQPLSVDKLQTLFGQRNAPTRQDIRAALMDLQADYAERGIELVEVASGYRVQIRSTMMHQLEKLWEERPPRYSRALLETLSIIVYRQPVTRGEIEDIRGVAVSSNIVRTLLERSWIKVVGHRDVPGKPAMFGTTREFLDYFNLKKLDELPPLSELKDFESLNIQLDLPENETEVSADEAICGQEADEDQLRDLSFAPDSDDAEDLALLDLDDDENNNVTSLDAVREAALASQPEAAERQDGGTEDDSDSATIVPLKTS